MSIEDVVIADIPTTVEDVALADIPKSFNTGGMPLVGLGDDQLPEDPDAPTWGEALWGGVKAGSIGIPAMVGSATRFVGEAIEGSALPDPMAITTPDPIGDPDRAMGLSKFGAVASRYWSDRAREHAPKYKGTFYQNPSWKRAASAVTTAGPSLAVAIGATAVGGPAAGAGVLSSLEGSAIFEEAREAGVGFEKASVFGAAGGIATFFLEKFGLEKILQSGSSRLMSTLVGGGAEGTTESLQEVVQNAIAKYGYEPTRNLWDGIIESFIGGGGAGGVVSGVMHSPIDDVLQDQITEAVSGLVEEEVINLTEEVVEDTTPLIGVTATGDTAAIDPNIAPRPKPVITPEDVVKGEQLVGRIDEIIEEVSIEDVPIEEMPTKLDDTPGIDVIEVTEDDEVRVTQPKFSKLTSEGVIFERPGVFLRFGPIPLDESGNPIKSMNHHFGFEEPGISTFVAWHDPKTGKYVLYTGDTELGASLNNLIGERHVRLLEGVELDEPGSDGEPMLEVGTLSVKDIINQDDIVTDDDPHLTLSGIELEEKDTPKFEVGVNDLGFWSRLDREFPDLDGRFDPKNFNSGAEALAALNQFRAEKFREYRQELVDAIIRGENVNSNVKGQFGIDVPLNQAFLELFAISGITESDLVGKPEIIPEADIVEEFGKQVWEMTRDEFDEAIVEEGLSNVERKGKKEFDFVLNNIQERLARRFGLDPANVTNEEISKVVLPYYQEKYNIEVPIRIGKRPNDAPRHALAKAAVYFGIDKATGGVTEIIIDPSIAKDSNKYNLASFRHEIEHVLDHVVHGVPFDKTKDVTHTTVSGQGGSSTIAQKLRASSSGHHARVDYFEFDYMRRAIIRDAIEDGKPVPTAIKEEVGLGDVIPLPEAEVVRDDVVNTPVGEFTPVDADHARDRLEQTEHEVPRLMDELELLKDNGAQRIKGEGFVQFVKSVGGWLAPHKTRGGGEYDYWRSLKESPLEESRRVARFLHNGTFAIDRWVQQHIEALRSQFGITDVAGVHEILDSYSRSYDGFQAAKGAAVQIDSELFAIFEEQQRLERFIEDEEGTGFDVTELEDEPLPLTEADEITIEDVLAEEVDALVGESIPPGGLSLRRVGVTPEPLADTDMKFDDPEIESRFRNAHGTTKEKFTDKARELIRRVWNKSTRPFEHLSNKIPEYAQIKQFLAKIPKNRAIAIDQTLQSLRGITARLNRSTFQLLERKIILDDLMFESSKGHELPFGFTPESLAEAHAKITALVNANPRVQRALELRKQFNDKVRADYTDIMGQIGIKVDFDNDNYFRHQVLLYANAKGQQVQSDKGIKSPDKRSFLKKRTGSSLDINTNYIEAESEVLAQMLHDIELAKVIQYVMRRFDVTKQVRSAMKEYSQQTGIPFNELRMGDFMPEGYAQWQPSKGMLFYLADSIPARIADQLMEGKLESYQLTADELSKVFAQAGRKMELIIPEDLAKTLDKPFPDKSGGPGTIGSFVAGRRHAIRMWKMWSLASPRRLSKYNIRNLSGDLEGIFLGNLRALKKVPQAGRDLWRTFFEDGAMSPMLRMWFNSGGFESTLQAQEMGDVHKLKVFEHIAPDSKRTYREMLALPWVKYWQTARLLTDFREGLLRYAAFLDYMEQLESGNLRNYGASVPADIENLEGNVNKAFKLSNDLLGAYDEITVTGREVRENLIPFWSFQEINLRRYWRLWKNAANDTSTASTVGKRAAVSAGVTTRIAAGTAIRIGKFVLAVMAMDTATAIYNQLVWPDEEEDLPESVQSKSHIILGRKDNGEVRYFSRLGLLQDVLDWFNLEDYRLTIREVLSGKRSLNDVIVEMAKGPVDKLAQGAFPFTKLAVELAGGRAFFPSVFEPRAIRDKKYHFFKSFGLEKEYVELMQLPSEGYTSTLADFFTYSVDPAQSKYSNILDKKNKFYKKINKGQGDGFFVSPRGNAMYNHMLSKKLGDKDGEKRFLKEYVKLTAYEGIRETPLTGKEIKERMNQSIKRAEPLYGLNDTEKAVFLSQLDDREKRDLIAAYEFWYEVLDGKTVR